MANADLEYDDEYGDEMPSNEDDASRYLDKMMI